MMYRWPPSAASHSKQQKCFMCQYLPSASVHSCARIIWDWERRAHANTLTDTFRSYSNRGFNRLETRRPHLVTGLAARLQPLSVVPATVHLPVLVEIDQINQQLAAGDTLETLRVPAASMTRPAGKNSNVSTADLPATLEKHIWSGWCRGN